MYADMVIWGLMQTGAKPGHNNICSALSTSASCCRGPSPREVVESHHQSWPLVHNLPANGWLVLQTCCMMSDIVKSSAWCRLEKQWWDQLQRPDTDTAAIVLTKETHIVANIDNTRARQGINYDVVSALHSKGYFSVGQQMVSCPSTIDEAYSMYGTHKTCQ